MNEQELFDLELKVLVEAIYQRYHYDFRNYAVSSLRRRMHQAMQRYDCARLSDLQHRLLHEPELFTQAMSKLESNRGAGFPGMVGTVIRSAGLNITPGSHD